MYVCVKNSSLSSNESSHHLVQQVSSTMQDESPLPPCPPRSLSSSGIFKVAFAQAGDIKQSSVCIALHTRDKHVIQSSALPRYVRCHGRHSKQRCQRHLLTASEGNRIPPIHLWLVSMDCRVEIFVESTTTPQEHLAGVHVSDKKETGLKKKRNENYR